MSDHSPTDAGELRSIRLDPSFLSSDTGRVWIERLASTLGNRPPGMHSWSVLHHAAWTCNDLDLIARLIGAYPSMLLKSCAGEIPLTLSFGHTNRSNHGAIVELFGTKTALWEARLVQKACLLVSRRYFVTLGLEPVLDFELEFEGARSKVIDFLGVG